MVFQPELGDGMSDRLRLLRLASFFASNLDQSAVRKSNVLRQVIQHHHSAKWRWQRRNQQPVISPCHAADDRSGGVSPQPVRREPFAAQQLPRVLAPSASQLNPPNQLLHFYSSSSLSCLPFQPIIHLCGSSTNAQC